ncbi:MAG: SPOR domain-containing protein [Gammaproteobacteria bacterium]|nr:SPOR domain-containing protein [Gammaproteobacteria bacterium]
MPARKRRRRKDQAAPGWAWLLVGLSIGLTVALFVYLHGGPRPGLDRAPSTVNTPLPRPTPIAAPAEQRAPAETREPVTQETAAASTAAEPETEFEFWERLGEFEIIVPDTPAELRNAVERSSDEQYVIQAGSFRSIADADRRKASLALLGIESQIYSYDAGAVVYYRVMIGPLTERAVFNQTMQRLAAAGIESLPRSRID